MSEFRDQVAKLLYNGIVETCGGYVESVPEDEQTAEKLYYTTVDGPIDFGQLADDVIGKLRPTIRTVEELDALPILSAVKELYKPAPSGNNYGAVWEKWNGPRWVRMGYGSERGQPYEGPIQLPALLIWSPAWERP